MISVAAIIFIVISIMVYAYLKDRYRKQNELFNVDGFTDEFYKKLNEFPQNTSLPDEIDLKIELQYNALNSSQLTDDAKKQYTQYKANKWNDLEISAYNQIKNG